MTDAPLSFQNFSHFCPHQAGLCLTQPSKYGRFVHPYLALRLDLPVRMSLRHGFSLLGLLLAFAPVGAVAQDLAIPARTLSPLFAQTPLPSASNQDSTSLLTPAPRSDRGMLIPLYASFAALQALDAHSTLHAIGNGGVERNPMLKGIAGKPAALVALKAGVAASTILLADRMRIRSRTGALVLMAALNSFYATVVAHNYATVR